MHSIISSILDTGYFKNNTLISYVCGWMVQKFVQKKWIIGIAFAQYTQLNINYLLLHNVYTYFYAIITQGLHTIIRQSSSVSGRFCTVYTGPITTTTYNIYERT